MYDVQTSMPVLLFASFYLCFYPRDCFKLFLSVLLVIPFFFISLIKDQVFSFNEKGVEAVLLGKYNIVITCTESLHYLGSFH